MNKSKSSGMNQSPPVADNKQLLETKVYDVCIIGRWVIGKFIVDELKDRWLKVCIIDWFEEDNLKGGDFYNIYEFTDKEWVWDKNATWNITFPTDEEIEELWFTLEEYRTIKVYLLSKLSWIDFGKYTDSEIDNLIRFIRNNLWIENIKYFFSARNKIEKRQILERWSFDKYWLNNKTFYDINHSDADVIKWNAIKFTTLNNGTVNDLLVKTREGTATIIANRFILANHTIWVLSLLHRTHTELWNNFIDNSKIWLWFVEHPQLSIWALIKDRGFSFKRELPTTYLYSDFKVDGINFRIEYHTAPPIQEKVNRYLYNGLSPKDFEERFIRFSCIIQQSPSAKKTLEFNEDWKLYATDAFKEEVEELARKVSKRLYEILFYERMDPETLDYDNIIDILNAESKIFFSWHLIWWIQFLTDETNYRIRGIHNLYVASSSTFKTWWLFNPTFTILCLAKKIIDDNFNSQN
jgi:hypothetical protein